MPIVFAGHPTSTGKMALEGRACVFGLFGRIYPEDGPTHFLFGNSGRARIEEAQIATLRR
jgi:hypothetical protein